jgi:hypothetical protein
VLNASNNRDTAKAGTPLAFSRRGEAQKRERSSLSKRIGDVQVRVIPFLENDAEF